MFNAQEIITEKLSPTKVDVKDTSGDMNYMFLQFVPLLKTFSASGGCGAMYDIYVESPLFKVKESFSIV